jgi:delta14-sterol reductase
MTQNAEDTETITTFVATTQVTLPLHPPKPSYDKLNPRSKPTEFLGPAGALAVTVGTPIMAYLLWFGCNESVGCPPPMSSWFNLQSLGLLPESGFGGGLSGWKGLFDRVFDVPAMLLYLAWYTYTVVCWYVLPGDWVEGTLLRDGTRRLYKINGASSSGRQV